MGSLPRKLRTTAHKIDTGKAIKLCEETALMYQAADEIQRLEAENDELKQLLDQYQGCDYIAKLEQHIGELIAEKKELRKKIPQWVPVNDPPKKPGDYLTMNSAGFVQQEYFEKNWAMDVQYWMPLPEPPKEQSD